MSVFSLFKVDLKGSQPDVQERDYLLDNEFFAKIENEDIPKGNVKVHAIITKVGEMFDFNFTLTGKVVIQCDRCLDDMDFPIDTTAHLIVKFGKDYAEESDEIVVIPEQEGVINLSWFLFEFVALTVPIKHVHGPGKCNKQMESKLKEHSAKSANDEEGIDFTDTDIIITDNDTEGDNPTDPRWDKLKDLNIE